MKKNLLIKLLAGILLLCGNAFAQYGVWKVLPGQMPNPAGGCKAVVMDSLIYVIGGYSDSTNQNLDIIQVYSPARNAWLPSIKMSSKRSGLIADIFQTGILICGGIDSLDLNASGLEYIDLKWPSGPKIWEKDINFNRVYATGKIHDNSLFVFGGNKSDIEGDSVHRSFIIEFNLKYLLVMYSSDATFYNLPVYQQMCAMVNDDIYLFGGVLNSVSPKVFKFNTISKNFTTSPTSLKAVRAGGEAVYNGNGLTFIIGGFNETQKSLASVDVYIHKSSGDAVDSGPQLHYARRNPAAVLYNGEIYVFGGFDVYNHTIGTVEKLEKVATSATNDHKSVPGSYVLYDNYPNPFNAGTQIKFSMPESGSVSLDVYTMLGEHVANITKNNLEAGMHTYSWNGKSDNGSTLGSGMYIYRLTAGGHSFSKKMVMLK